MSAHNIFLIVFCLLSGVISEPVRKCLSNEVFQKASCKEIRNFISGSWAEVRRLPLPFPMYREDDCVVWNASPRYMNSTYAEFHLQALVSGEPVEGLMPSVMKVEEKSSCQCRVSMNVEIPKLEITKNIEDWWITFDDDHQLMVGYVCIPNPIAEEREKGFRFRNMLFIYLKPQLTAGRVRRVKSSLDIIVDRLSEELKSLEEETKSNWKELKKSKCKVTM